jgi:hypothetical protein
MLTLESKFAEFISLCVKNGACSDKGEAVPVMEEADKGVGMPVAGSCAEGFALYRDNEKFPSAWASWVLDKVGKEMDEKCRAFFISKLKDPMVCLKLAYKCPFLSVEEIGLLRAKYEGQGEDVAKAVICCDAIVKSREFNAVRVAAVTTCKSVTEAKALIELKTDVVTTVSADSAVKSSGELKEILESERTKVTLATNEVMRGQGFVDENGNGSVSVFEAWLGGV